MAVLFVVIFRLADVAQWLAAGQVEAVSIIQDVELGIVDGQ
jgi:hypothetical protein